MMSLKLPLVGMHFHPPAKVLLEHLPAGTPLILVADPQNQYDHLAILVMLELAENIPPVTEALLEALGGFGFTLEELHAASPVTLGHIGATGSKASLQSGCPDGNVEVHGLVAAQGLEWPLRAVLAFGAAGRPCVIVEDAGDSGGNGDSEDNGA